MTDHETAVALVRKHYPGPPDRSSWAIKAVLEAIQGERERAAKVCEDDVCYRLAAAIRGTP